MWDFWPILKQKKRYLKGEVFSNSLEIPYAKNDGVHEGSDLKNEWLCDVIRNRSVLHVGCVDHLPLLQDKMKAGTWLHAHLVDSAHKCVGLDISDEGINALRDHGVKDVYSGDVTDPGGNASLREQRWDYILVPDVIEHIPEPGAFLSSLSSLWGKEGGRLIVTVPNEVCFLTLRDSLFSKGVINSDHKHAYSLYILARLVMSSGWEIEKAGFLSTFGLPWSKPIRRLMLAQRPALSNVLVIVARYPDAS